MGDATEREPAGRRAAVVLFAMLATLGVMAVVAVRPASATDVTLRLHHFLPTTSTAHQRLIAPWAQRVETQSDGRIAVEIYPSMQLGGKPPQLFDQVRDGVVDLVWTVAGYTPGRFPKLEVIELPFVAATARATSAAAHEYATTVARDELAAVHPILVHVHAPGALHMRGRPVRRRDDLVGARIRVPSRPINDALAALGATPVGMPVPQVPEALSRGVVDGAVLPFEVARPLRIHELVDSHTEFAGERGFYTLVFLLLMNKDRYRSLAPALRRVIDDNAGIALALEAGAIWDEAEESGRREAVERGNQLFVVDGAELARWQEATRPVILRWIDERTRAGDDGEALLATARALITKYSR